VAFVASPGPAGPGLVAGLRERGVPFGQRVKRGRLPWLSKEGVSKLSKDGLNWCTTGLHFLGSRTGKSANDGLGAEHEFIRAGAWGGGGGAWHQTSTSAFQVNN
jgi:hypothetical protein